jgi:hypothetical protein
VQRAAVEVLRDDERPTGVLADVEDGDDVVRPGEPRRSASLALEPLAGLGLARVPFREHLDRDRTAEHGIGRPVHLGHPAACHERR